MANRLPTEKRAQILGLLVEGNSLRAISRLADVSINTEAARARQEAAKTSNPDVQNEYLKLAAEWDRLAQAHPNGVQN